MPLPIDPSFAISGAEWSVPPAAAPSTPAPAQGGGFGQMLTNSLDSLEKVQNDASQAATSLADGTATDANSVVMAVERARLSMQLAAQIRTKAVESLQDIFHTQI
jgi:flagellar hook-basal body complex protein FliE